MAAGSMLTLRRPPVKETPEGRLDISTRSTIEIISLPSLHSFHHLTTMSAFKSDPVDDVCIATIRTLAADVVGKANSGHPGMFSLSVFPTHRANI